MKIIIPMAGKGKRFNAFLSPKPLIEVDGKPMIEHVINCFPRKSEFVFICHENHLKSTNVEYILKKIAPDSKIISVSDEYLGGPAVTITAAFNIIDDEEPVIINYCDFIQIWDFNNFLNGIKDVKPDGAIVSFKGFHPASLGDTYYAYMKVDENNMVEEIKEKESYSNDRTNDYASTGTYYFSSGKILKKYVKELIQRTDLAVNNEFYCSLPYVLMLRDKLKIFNYEVEKFICLGTPRDYELYKFWSELFLKYSPSLISFSNVNLNVTNIFPLAGGERDFKSIGFNELNFMIPIMNKPMINYSLGSNPKGIKNIFVLLKDNMKEIENLPALNDYNAEIILLDKKTESNAATIYEAISKIDPNKSICVSGATYILDYNERRLSNLMEQNDIDIILFSFSHHECVLRNPDGVAYAKLKNNIEVDEIVEKKTISNNPYSDHALTGTAVFKKSSDLSLAIEMEFKKTNSNNALYLTCLNNILKDRKIVIFEVDKFVPIRTVTNYKEFVYWQEYFAKMPYHPYSKVFQ